MAIILSDSKSATAHHEVFTPENLLLMDETVKEVFGMMLGIDIKTEGEIASTSEAVRHEQTAIVGFAGAMSGICEISIGTAGSLAITGAMLGGVEVAAASESVCDAVGELCNMLAGGWKNRIPLLGSACSLSVPTVIEGVSYQVHRPANAKMNRRSYKFGENKLLLTLLYDPK
ncbi:MAG TPA: chemotaxis protein CheX [Granulicella sp.]|nr:chemotaxis protein CheX [Granulicella sp.]